MSTQIIGHTAPNSSAANVACTAEEVLAGLPFHGTVFQKRQGQKVFLARISEDEPTTIDRAREEIGGFQERVAIHTLVDGEAHEISVNVGVVNRGKPTGPTDIVEQKAKDSHHAHVRERYERRMTELRDDLERRIQLRDDTIEAERQKRCKVEDELAELRRRHHEELQQIRREHRQEVDQVRRKMENLREEKTNLYIESQLGRAGSESLQQQLLSGLVDNMPKLVNAAVSNFGQEKVQEQPAALQEAPEPNRQPAAGHQPQAPSESRSQPVQNPVSTGDGAMSEAPTLDEPLRYDDMNREQRCGFLVGQVLAVATGSLDAAEFEAATDQIIADIEADGELTISDWAGMVSALGHHAHHAGLSAENVGEAVRPLLRQYVKEGSEAEMALKRFPAKQAANMLIAATGHDAEPPVRAMVQDVLAYYKQQL